MNAEQIVVAALARGLEFSNEFPTTRSVYYRRITVRQQQLFVRAAEINPDYFGVTGSVALTAGEADLAALLDPQAERIYQVRIDDPGTSAYDPEQRVNIIAVDDGEYAGLAPRVTIRDYVVRQFVADLDGVTSLLIDYSKRPADIALPADVPELPEQFHELLVIDATKSAVRRVFSVTKEQRSGFLDLLTEEENELLAAFDAHVERFSSAEESRFGRTARPVGAPKSARS